MSNSKYNFWTWLIAIILAIYLFWQWGHGHGTGGCCSAPVAEAVAPVAAVETFTCNATADQFTSAGDTSAVSWLAKSADLSAWLKAGGADWQASCNDTAVTLTGTVDSEDVKTKAGADAQVFFGDTVTVDNQLMVKMAEATPEPVAAAMPPPAANLYFDTSKTNLASGADATLAPIVEWLKANPNAKAVISGYHDPRGNQAFNENLAKNRAQAVNAALLAAGIEEARIEMRKPASTEGSGDLAEARRVEVTVE